MRFFIVNSIVSLGYVALKITELVNIAFTNDQISLQKLI